MGRDRREIVLRIIREVIRAIHREEEGSAVGSRSRTVKGNKIFSIYLKIRI